MYIYICIVYVHVQCQYMYMYMYNVYGTFVYSTSAETEMSGATGAAAERLTDSNCCYFLSSFIMDVLFNSTMFPYMYTCTCIYMYNHELCKQCVSRACAYVTAHALIHVRLLCVIKMELEVDVKKRGRKRVRTKGLQKKLLEQVMTVLYCAHVHVHVYTCIFMHAPLLD